MSSLADEIIFSSAIVTDFSDEIKISSAKVDYNRQKYNLADEGKFRRLKSTLADEKLIRRPGFFFSSAKAFLLVVNVSLAKS